MADNINNDHLNRDPITGEPGSHPIGTAVGGLGGAAAGAAIGAIGGPLGMLIGGAIGAIAGGSAGHAAGEPARWPGGRGRRPATGHRKGPVAVCWSNDRFAWVHPSSR